MTRGVGVLCEVCERVRRIEPTQRGDLVLNIWTCPCGAPMAAAYNPHLGLFRPVEVYVQSNFAYGEEP